MDRPLDVGGQPLKEGDKVVMRGTVQSGSNRYGVFVKTSDTPPTVVWLYPQTLKLNNEDP